MAKSFYRRRLVRLVTLLLPLLLPLLLSDVAFSQPIAEEVLSGNGETRVLTIRNVTVAQPGRYFLVLTNGDLGPRMVHSCYTYYPEGPVEELRQCLFDNVTEKIEQSFSRMNDALIHINGVRIRNPLAPNEKTITKARGLVSIPVTLVEGANEIRFDYLGYTSSRLQYSLELAPETASPPQAYFLTNRIQGTTAQSFNLNARESLSPEGSPITYAWLWGDEPEGTLPVVGEMTATHMYAAAGTYTASLVVTDTATSQISTFAIEFVVKAVNPSTPDTNEKPKPVIQWAIDGSDPFRVLFDGSQSTDDGSIASYTWRITNQAGVAEVITGPNFHTTFANAGAYTIRLTIRDDLNLAAAVERVISIAPAGLLVETDVLFPQNSYYGSLSTESITDETLTLPAPRLARLVIRNGDGLDHPIEDCAPIAWPGKIECLFSNLLSKTYLSLYRVNSVNVFINGRKVTDATSVTKKTAIFETVVSLSATNTIQVRVRGWPTAFATVEFHALEQNTLPVASIGFDGLVGRAPGEMTFNGLLSTDPDGHTITNWHWLFSDGGEAWGPMPIYYFAAAGEYTVTLRVQDEFDAWSDPVSVTVSLLHNELPIGLFTVQDDPSNRYIKTFDASASFDMDGSITEYVWYLISPGDTGDAVEFGYGPELTHTFPGVGTYTVILDVFDNNYGKSVATLVDVTISDQPTMIKAFYEVDEFDPMKFAFKASETTDADGIQSFKWLENEVELSSSADFEHTFSTEGVHSVTLEVRDMFGSVASKNFLVHASQSPIAGIMVLAADLDPIDFFEAGTIDEQSLVPISTLPAAIRLQPKLTTARGELDFEWSLNGIESGLSDTLITSIVEPGILEIELKVKNGDNIVARTRRQTQTEPTACQGDSDEICVTVRNGLLGPSLNTDDLVFEIPHGEDITSVGRLVIRTGGIGEELDFTEYAVASGQTVSVPRAILLSRLYYKPGPFEAEMEVAGETDTSFGVTPYFHLSGRSLVAPTDLENAQLKLVDSISGRVVLNRGIASGEVITGPWSSVEIEITETADGTTWTSRGRVDSRADWSHELFRQRSSNLLGLGTVSARVADIPDESSGDSGAYSSMSSFSTQSVTAQSLQLQGVVAGTHTFLRNLPPFQDAYYTAELSHPMADGPPAKYSMKAEFVPWMDENDSPEIIGADTDQVRTLECKAFESAWNATPEVLNYYNRIGGFLEIEQRRIKIAQGFKKLNDPLQAENAWLAANVDTAGCSTGGGYDPDCLATAPLESYANNTPQEIARARAYAPFFYNVRRYQEANSATAEQLMHQSDAFVAEAHSLGLTGFPRDLSLAWASVGLSDKREFEVTMRVLKNSKWIRSTYKFSSEGRKGSFEAPAAGPTIQNVPVDPFSVPSTKPALLQVHIPKGTEAVTFEIAPTNKRREIKSYRVYSRQGGGAFNIDGDVGKYTDSYSAACRFSNEGYIVRSVRNAPDLTNPGIQADALNMLRQIDFGLSPQILMLLRRDNIFPNFNLHRAVAYISKSLFSVEGFIPTDIDSVDSSANSNTLWRDVRLRPTPAQLNYAVRVEVDHPLGLPPDRLEFGAYSSAGTESSPLVSVLGNRISNESVFTRSVYRVDIPVDALVLAARATALSPQPNENRLTLEFKPIPPPTLVAPVSQKQFSPRVLFNARYKNFFDASGGTRAYYSQNSSSMVSAKMARTITALDTIGVTSSRPGHTNDLFINDASLPFGLSFKNDHDGHEDGEKLDIRTFGLSSNLGYESVTKDEGRFSSFPSNSKFGDLAKLIRVTRSADEVNRNLSAPLLRENQCVVNTSNPSATNPCLNQITVEECLFVVDSPVPASSCAAIHQEVYLANPAIVTKEDSVSAHNRIRNWVLRNREAILAFKAASTIQSLDSVFYYSTGISDRSRSEMIRLINNGSNTLGRILPLPGQVVAKSLADDWNMASLVSGAIPMSKNTSGEFGESYLLVLENGNPLPDATPELSTMFEPESATGHFDHFHVKPRGSR